MSEYDEFLEEELRELVSAAREELHSWIANIPPEAHDGQPDEHRLFSELCDAVEALQKERDHWKANHDNMTAQNELLRTRLDLDANDPATQAAQRFRIIAERDALQQRVGELERERNRYLDALQACQCANCKAVEP